MKRSNMKYMLNLKMVLICLLITLLFNQSNLLAQTPGTGIFFQAIARDQYTNPAKDRKIYVEASIIQTSATGTKVLIETHQTTTDGSGVFSISVGQGKRSGGTVASLDKVEWAKGPYYLNLKISITPMAPIANWDYTKDWIDLGTSPFGTVPYALYSGSSGALDDKLSIADTSKMLAIYAKAQVVNSLSTQVNSKLSASDTTTMLAPYAKMVSALVASNITSLTAATVNAALDSKVNVADSGKLYVTPLSIKKGDSITNAALVSKLNIADSGSKYVTPLQLKGVTFDTTSLITKINKKVNLSDSTTVFITPLQLAAKNFDSTAIYAQLATKLNKADTASLSNRINLKSNTTDVTTGLALKLNITDTTILLRKADTSTLSNRINLKANTADVTSGLALKFNKTDTSLLLQKADTAALSNRINLKANTADVTSSLALKLDASQRGVANGVASLDINSKVPASQIPVVSFQSANVVASQAAMLALSSAVVGSIAIRTDISRNFILSGADPAIIGNWVELAVPTSVTTINGIPGAYVTLTTNEIGEGATNKYYTDTRARNAISASGPLNYNAAAGTFSITAASTSSNGYLSASDFTTFNNKQNTLVAGTDYATPSGNITGNAANVTGVVSIVNGGTGTTTATGALTTLGAEARSNKSTATDLGSTNPSDILFPSQKAVKTYVDQQSANAGVADLSITNAKLAGNITAAKLVGTDITTVGTITAGVWSGTTIALNKGGTGATTATDARTNLGLVIGTDVLAQRTFGTAANNNTADFVAANVTITGATKTKLTYDAKGLVTAGADATTADIAPSTDRNYVTDAQKAGVLSNTSGTNTGDETTSTIKTKLGITTLSGSNTGDQTITLTGDVIGTGTGSFASTLTNTTVTAGAYGSSTAIPTFTVDSKGRLTAAGTTSIVADAGTLSGTITTAGKVANSATTASSANTANAIVARDGSGNFTANIITGTLSGTATNISGILAVANGGTGLTSVGSNGQVLSSNGTSIAWTNPAATGITSINGITSGTQTLTVGTSGTAPAFSSTSSTHTLNIPLASATSVTAGLLSKSDYDLFTAKQTALTAGSGISISGGTISATGLTTSNLSSIANISNSQLANSSTILGSTTMTLGGTVTSVTGLTSLSATNLSGALTGNASTATALAAGRTISTIGDITYTSGSFDGSANVTGTATLTNTTVTQGSYGSSTAIPTFTVDSKGRLTAASTVGITAGVSSLNYTTTTSYAAGGTISGTSLTLAAADASNPGLISTGAQTIVGAKTFSSTTTFNEDIKVNDITIGVGRRDNSSITSTAVGKLALGLNTTGSGNTALGQLSMSFNTTGGFNSAAGSQSLGSNTTGSFNTAFGNQSLGSNTTGTYNTAIGFQANVSSANLTNATAIGNGAIVDASNKIQIGNASVTSVVTSGTISATGFTGPLTGNASTATKLATARNINGTAFDGTANITIVADANTLTGTTLASNVVNSNLTSVGTITSGTWSGSVIGSNVGGAGTVSGLMKANGSGVVSAAVAGTDFQAPYANLTNIGSITNSAGYLKNVGSGTFTYVGSITDTDLSTITTAGKVSNTATTATSANTANTIVARDASGNFTAGTITGTLSGTASTSTNIAGGAIGAIPYQSAAGTTALLSGNNSSTVMYLTSSGNGTISTAPTWVAPSFVPYTGATGAVNLGAYDLKVNGMTVGLGNGNGISNTAIGKDALLANTGSSNTAIGFSTLSATTGSSNTAIGEYALWSNTSGYNNTASGANTLSSNTTGFRNTASGSSALSGNTIGTGNTASGVLALNANTSGSNNTAIGHQANVASGSLSNTTAIGANAIVSASNTIQLGNTAVTDVRTSGTLTAGAVTYPNTHGSANQLLISTGSGTLTWTTIDASTLSGTTLKSTITGSSLTSVGTITSGTWSGSVIGSSVGGAGTVSGLMKANGSGVVSAAVAGTDFQLPISAGTGVTISTNVVSIGQTVTTTATPTFAGQTLTGTLTATTANFSGNITASSLNVTGATSLSSLTASGTSTLTALTVNGAATFSSTVKISTGAAAGKVLTSDASGNATWQNTGGTIVTMSATGTATSTATYIIFTGSTASQTITIPSAVTLGAGREITIKNVASVSVSIASAGGYLIQDNSTLTSASAALGIEPSNNWMKLVSDGTNWYIFRALF